MNNNKIVVLGLVTALCFMGMLDITYGNGNFSKALETLLFLSVGLIFTLPVMMIYAILTFLLMMIALIVTNTWGIIGLMALAIWYKNRK